MVATVRLVCSVVHAGIIDAGDGHCLRCRPVAGGEGQRRWVYRGDTGIAARHGYGHGPRGLRIQPHSVGGRTARLGRPLPEVGATFIPSSSSHRHTHARHLNFVVAASGWPRA